MRIADNYPHRKYINFKIKKLSLGFCLDLLSEFVEIVFRLSSFKKILNFNQLKN